MMTLIRIISIALRWLGSFLLFCGIAFLAFVAAYPLGLVRAYPMPPESYRVGPLGMKREICDVRELNRKEGEPNDDYFERLAKTVSDGIVHYWHAGDSWDESDMPYTRINVWDNYLMWILSFRPGFENLKAVEFMTPEKAIRRGYGFCSQASRIVYTILKQQGFEPRILFNKAHVVVEVEGVVIDADYGVFIPHNRIRMAESADDLIPIYYVGFEREIPSLIEAFGAGLESFGDTFFDEITHWEAEMEALKWLPPLALVEAGLVLLFATGFIRAKSSQPAAMS